MASFNSVVLMGNLTRDPQLKYLPNQTAVAEFGLAVNDRYKNKAGEMKEDVTFVDIAAFGKQAEHINQYCQKGKQVLVSGRLKYETWEDKSGGGKRSKLSVVADRVQFLGARQDNGGGQNEPAGVGAGEEPESNF